MVGYYYYPHVAYKKNKTPEAQSLGDYSNVSLTMESVHINFS